MGTHANALPYFLFSTLFSLRRYHIKFQCVATKLFFGRKKEKFQGISFELDASEFKFGGPEFLRDAV